MTGIYAREHSVEHAIDLCMEHAPNGFVYTDYVPIVQKHEEARTASLTFLREALAER